jgi:flagellar biosynthesis protein FlhA
MSTVEASTPTSPVARIGGFNPRQTLGDLGRLGQRSDLLLAAAVMGIIVLLIVPLPAMALDLMLAVSITFSVLILLTALFIEAPLEFSAFPTVLLIATMLRLSLNVATTRLILSNGHKGPSAAGHVIEAFGNFVMSGNFVIGIVVFAILLIVNFIVITKGSGRIAEVAARFTLDAMPGKQMAIDAELAAGHIDEKVARTRRKNLEDESSFFGAMDGASKFVRGDAIAGLLITFINIIGGIIIGVAQEGLSFSAAAKTYTLLTVGDGVVSQIPALIVSTAAGMLVSKAGVSGAADKALVKQLATMPKALGLSAGVIGMMAFLPGIPLLPFMGIAVGLGLIARRLKPAEKSAAQIAEQSGSSASQTGTEPESEEQALSEAKRLDELRIEIGYALMPLINGGNGADRLTEQIKALRRTLAGDMGFVMPSVRILDNVMLPGNSYSIRLKEIEAGTGQVYPGQFMAMDPSGAQVKLPGIHMLEPTFGLPATWIEAPLKEDAQLRGYTVVDASTVVTTHLTEIIKANISELLGYSDVQKLIRDLPKEHTDLVKDIVPSQIAMTTIQRVLQGLLAERVSIRDLGTIIEGIAEATSFTKSTRDIIELVRQRLSRQLCAQYANPQGQLPIIALSPHWETLFAEAIVGHGEDRHLAMQPSKMSEFASIIREAFDDAARQGEMPALVTSALARPFVRAIVERFRRETPVLSQAEIHLRTRLKTVGSI